ncbi:CD9 antigen-like isoform X1 [Haliotis asinina]|uniref:CD9 antigen-like isoform X1 n=1 Tax=Haliotis asinina TaxID=109174 RepID=UPI0035324CE8
MCSCEKFGCIKYLLYAFNVLFLILGLGIVGFGIWIRVDPDAGKYINESVDFNALLTASSIFIGTGCFILFVGVVGICGTIRRSQCLLVVFFIGLFIIFLVLLATGVIVLIQMDNVKDAFGDYLQSKVNVYHSDKDAKLFIHNLQKAFHCCGAKLGRVDYPIATIADAPCEVDTFLKPCAEEFFQTLAPNLGVTAGVAFIGTFIMIVGMVLSMMFCCAVRKASP